MRQLQGYVVGVPGRRAGTGGVEQLSGDGGPSGLSHGGAFILRLEPRDGVPVRGTLAPVGDDAAALSFDGWVELMSALETLRVRTNSSSSAKPDQGPLS